MTPTNRERGAEEIASEVCGKLTRSDVECDMQPFVDEVAKSLDAYADAKLEEAAKICQRSQCCHDRDLAVEIRSLKSKACDEGTSPGGSK